MSAQRIQPSQVLAQQRVDDPPLSAGDVLGDPGPLQQLEHPVADRRCQAARGRLPVGDGAGDDQGALVQSSDLLHGLLHRRQVAGQRRLVADGEQVEIDRPGVELHRDQVGLLGDDSV